MLVVLDLLGKRIGQARRGTHRATLDQSRYHRDFLVHAELVHDSSIPERYGMSRRKRRKTELFCGFSFCAPALLSSRLAHCGPFLRVEERHTVLPPDFASFTAHCGHNLRHQGKAYRNRLGFSYGLQDYAARVLNHIQTPIGAIPWYTCAFWHRTLSLARIPLSCQVEEISK